MLFSKILKATNYDSKFIYRVIKFNRGENLKIYADIFFIVNLYLDYFILLAVKKFLNYDTKTNKLLLASFTGACFSLVSLLINNLVLNFALAFVIAVFLCYISFYKGDVRSLIKSYICFMFLSFVFSGITLILSFISSSAVLIGGKPYFDLSVIQLFIFTVVCYLCTEAYRKIKAGNTADINYCKIIVEHKGKAYELYAKKDTGNSLIEPFSGLPVIVVEKGIISSVDENIRLIPFSSLGGKGLLKGFKADKIYIKKSRKELNCYLAVYDGKLGIGAYNSLVNPEIFI